MYCIWMDHVAKASSKNFWMNWKIFSIERRLYKKNYHEEIDEGYFLKVDVHYSKKLYELHMSERMKLGKIKKLVTSLCDKNEYAIHIRNLKQALNHGLVLKKFIE